MTALPSILTPHDSFSGNTPHNWVVAGGTISGFVVAGAQLAPTVGGTSMTLTLPYGLYSVYGAGSITAHCRCGGISPSATLVITLTMLDGSSNVLASGSTTLVNSNSDAEISITLGAGTTWLSRSSVSLKVTVVRQDGNPFTASDGCNVSFNRGFFTNPGLYLSFPTGTADTPITTPTLAHYAVGQTASGTSLTLTPNIVGTSTPQACGNGEVIGVLVFENGAVWNAALPANVPAGFLMAEWNDPENSALYIKLAGASEPGTYTFSGIPGGSRVSGVLFSVSASDINRMCHLCDGKTVQPVRAPSIQVPISGGLLGLLDTEDGGAGGPYFTGVPPAGFTTQADLVSGGNLYGALGLTKNAPPPTTGSSTANIDITLSGNVSNCGCQFLWGPQVAAVAAGGWLLGGALSSATFPTNWFVGDPT